MPYCPKCDMEFVDGITICSDCKEPLVASKELVDAIKKQEQEEASDRRKAEFLEMQEKMEAESSADAASDTDAALPAEKGGRPFAGNSVYIKKSQQYDDLKSSAVAFMLVGAGLFAFSILCWLNIIKLPLAGTSRIISQSVMTILSIAALGVYISSSQKAKMVHTQIADEEHTTQALIQWFTGQHTGAQLDSQILAESGEIAPEELSLKRFDLIQDILITNHDIADQSYVDLIAEEIYGELYQD